MKRSATVAVCILGSAVLAGSALFVHRHEVGLKLGSKPAASASAASGAAIARSPLSREGWQVGAQYVQAVEYHLTLGQESEPEQAGQGLNLGVKGELRSVVYEASAERVKVRYELASVQLESATPTPEAESGKKVCQAALAQPFAVEYDAGGRALQLLVQPDLEPIALGVLRELVATSQLTQPASPAQQWSALESDVTGEYQAEYLAAGALAWQRQKSSYARIASPQGLRAAGKASPRIRGALTRFKLDDWGRAAELESHSEVSTPPALDGAGPLFVSVTDVRLRFVSRSKLAPGATAVPAGLQLVALTPGVDDFARAAGETDRAIVQGATPKQLLGDLDKVEPGDHQGASTVQVRMSALVRQQPSAIPPLISRLNAKNAPTILGALGSAGSPEAQKALADVTRDTGREGSVRQAAVDSMLSLENPTPEVPAALQTAMESEDPSLRNNSSLMLGVMSRRMGENEPEQAAAVNEKLVTDLNNATDTSDKLRLLGSLGNAGATQGLPQIAEALKSTDPAVRAQAASSLRFVKDPQADELLSSVMTTDEVVLVRSAAVAAAAFRNYAPLATALEGAAKDAEASLRLQVVATLGTLASEDGEALLLLDRMAQSDESKDVREHAKSALERINAAERNQ
jgi:HEAT repeat protein